MLFDSALPDSGLPDRGARPSIDRMVVVVPAHNELVLLPACLAALEAAARAVDVPVDTVVVLDTCVDGTDRVIPPHVQTVTVTERSVGAARRAGFADRVTDEQAAHTWFATTDADSVVPPGWLTAQLAAAAAGADAFVGTVTPAGWGDWAPTTSRLFAERYLAEPDHRHVHGANLGVRADCYLRVGGFSRRTGDEDVDLVRRLVAAGARVDRSCAAPVVTSTRRDGRTDAGFAAHLHRLEAIARAEDRHRGVVLG